MLPQIEARLSAAGFIPPYVVGNGLSHCVIGAGSGLAVVGICAAVMAVFHGGQQPKSIPVADGDGAVSEVKDGAGQRGNLIILVPIIDFRFADRISIQYTPHIGTGIEIGILAACAGVIEGADAAPEHHAAAALVVGTAHQSHIAAYNDVVAREAKGGEGDCDTVNNGITGIAAANDTAKENGFTIAVDAAYAADGKLTLPWEFNVQIP